MSKLVQVSWKMAILVLVVVLAAACGQRATAIPSPTPLPPTSTQVPASPTPAPTATAVPPSPTPLPTVPPTPVPTPPRVSNTPTAPATVSAVVATGDGALNVRGGPGTDYPILGQLQPDTQVMLLARSADGTWFEIAYPTGSDGRGWLSGEFLQIQGSADQLPVAQAPAPPSPTPPATAPPSVTATPAVITGTLPISGTVSAVVATGDGALNVRGGPGTDYPVLGQLQPGAQVTLLARSADGTWFEIVYPAGSDGRGWLSGEFLQIQGSAEQLPVAQPPAPPRPTPIATTLPSITATPTVTGTSPISGTVSAVVATGGGALNVRGGPGTDYPVLGQLQPGAQVTLLARSADGTWFEIAYPASSDGRGWLSGEFLQMQGAAEQLPVAQAPAPTVTPTLAAVEACAPISGQSYGTLAITSAPTDRPAESNADLNLGLRGFASVDVPKALIELSGATDPNGPQLRGLFGDQRVPTVTGTYQVYNWDWGTNSRGGLITNPEVTLLGAETTAGEIIHTPGTGRDLGEGYVAMVLYATQSRITLKYTRDDNVVAGYTVHIENVCVEPTLQALYQKMNEAGRLDLPALRPGQPLGRATGAQIDVAVRDDGSFLDPRSAKDWWSQP
jgi:uncharacterized protein YraI